MWMRAPRARGPIPEAWRNSSCVTYASKSPRSMSTISTSRSDTPPHTTEAFAIATYTPEEARTAEMRATLAESDRLCRRLLDADALLFAMPMYNFSIPSAFKAFIDAIVRTNVTYKVTPQGGYEGQLARQKVLFITSRGADLRPGGPFEAYDALTPSLRAAFGFLGVTQPWFVDAQPLQFADQPAREAALRRAEAELIAVAAEWGARIRAAA